MAQLYCTGPAHVFVGFSNQTGVGTPLYLGTAEDAPEIELGPEFEPVMNDISGKKKPLDMQYQGEDALISVDLNRYNEATYALLAQRINSGAPRGTDNALDIGSLAATEGLQLCCAILFPFAAKPAMGAGGMPPGYYFPAVVPIGPEKLTMGTKPKKVNVLLYAWPLYNFATGTFTLYTNTLPSLGPIT